MKERVSVFWFRRDLRLNDNRGLSAALDSGFPVLPVFIFDTDILGKLDDKKDRRVTFIYRNLQKINEQLAKNGSRLFVFYGKPVEIWKELPGKFNVASAFWNGDYEPYARRRDEDVAAVLAEKGIPAFSFKDQVVFEKSEIVKDDGMPYTVFTPYKNKWRRSIAEKDMQEFPSEKRAGNFLRTDFVPLPPLSSFGFEETEMDCSVPPLNDEMLRTYSSLRDFPARRATSHLSVHLRFGTVSIRALFRRALAVSETWTNELIWREFFMQVLWHFPHVEKDSFRKEYDRIAWRNNEEEFERWKNGMTGFPLVDAGMRELNETGFMHNRVRMMTASFLVKHLLIDWRWGEAYFASKLLDFDLAANNGNWQWAAGTGTDAAPYFRIFNPHEQQKKFDPEFEYVKKWVKEFGTEKYPLPLIDHAAARGRCLAAYSAAVKD
ncbi:MAG TPA: deoxyribodipyrimidine photo-lyase [Bacteroidia bacterium]|nr:deoxyribodipyrimidine photo-lyase [Bacteroidia bacterium]